MKARCELRAGDLEMLYERIDRLLDRVGLETQPKVAARILQLVQDPAAEINEYAGAIKTDWTLTGRILKLANSAFYAQRSPVTRLDRALVLLGIERTKAVAMGFYLGRSAASAGHKELVREVWGQSVYRAGLCAAMAKIKQPAMAAEAFIIGLLLDCGVPLMAKLVGPEYINVYKSGLSPQELFDYEQAHYEFTHVDVAVALMRRWRLPDTLSRPVMWHHVPAPARKAAGPAIMMQRLAYYTGSVRLSAEVRQEEALPAMAGELFQITEQELGEIIQTATREYQATAGAFSDFAKALDNPEAINEQVHIQLVQVMDDELARAVRAEAIGVGERFVIGGQHVEIEPRKDGDVLAYISAPTGERLISVSFKAGRETPGTVVRLLGIDNARPEEIAELVKVINAMAA